MRYDLESLLPIVARRINRGDFTSQGELANAYGVWKGATSWWKRRAVDMGLLSEAEWRAGFLKGQLNRLAAT